MLSRIKGRHKNPNKDIIKENNGCIAMNFRKVWINTSKKEAKDKLYDKLRKNKEEGGSVAELEVVMEEIAYLEEAKFEISDIEAELEVLIARATFSGPTRASSRVPRTSRRPNMEIICLQDRRRFEHKAKFEISDVETELENSIARAPSSRTWPTRASWTTWAGRAARASCRSLRATWAGRAARTSTQSPLIGIDVYGICICIMHMYMHLYMYMHMHMHVAMYIFMCMFMFVFVFMYMPV